MKYDPNWLVKQKIKQVNKELASLTHLIVDRGNVALCGRYAVSNGTPLIQFPSIDRLPGCRTCREKYLDSIGVNYCSCCGYPKCKNV